MEYASGGDLLKKIQNGSHKMKESEMQHIFCQILSAINYIHNIKHYVHHDLKLDNILFDSDGNIRIIDFGLSGEITAEQPQLMTQYGNFYYAAPEVLRNKPHSYPVDIWSCGVILYAMATGSLPFNDNNTHNLILKAITADPEFPNNMSPNLKDLILKMLCKNPDDRITIPQIAQHPWIQESRYSYYISENFLYSPKYRCIPLSINDIDVDVVNKLKTLDVDVTNIADEMVQHVENDSTMCYKILKKQKIIKLIGSNSEIRMMYSLRRSAPNRSTVNSHVSRARSNSHSMSPDQARYVLNSKSSFEKRKRKVHVSNHQIGVNFSLPPLKK